MTDETLLVKLKELDKELWNEGFTVTHPAVLKLREIEQALTRPAPAAVGELEAELTRLDDPRACIGKGQYIPLHRDTLRRILTALRGARGWQPIETAPKDGTWILAGEFGNPDFVGDYYAASWAGDAEGGLWCAKCGQYVTQAPEPTHWMPLPPAPERGQ